MRYLLIILSFVLVSNIVYAADGSPQELWQEANKAYKAEQYKEAIQKYESILSTGNYSKELYYNLGNSYYQEKQIASSILHFERALKISPYNKDVQYNLSIAKLELADDIEVLPPFFLAAWWKNIHQLTSSTSWAILSILMMIIGVAGLIMWLIGQDRSQKKRGFIGGISLIALSLLFLGLAFSQSVEENNSGEAIIMTQEINLQSAPESQSNTILQLHEGTKVTILDQIGDWYKVLIANGEQGWIEKNTIEKI